jgi:protein tyrosine/serine phosphatase
MTADRHLEWEGSFNARDLGGLPAAGGRRTHWGAAVRADAPDHLTRAGWAALQAHGVRTIIDLRNDHERGVDASARPAGITTLELPLDGVEDREFWDRWEREPPPLYYGPFLERFPDRAAAVVAAIACAEPGGVLFHCVGGRDRTGLVALLLLALVGVDPRRIAADHALSADRVDPVHRRLGIDERGEVDRLLAEHGTSAYESVAATAAAVDVEACLRGGGLGGAELAAVRARMLAP